MKVKLFNHRCFIQEATSEEIEVVERECKVVYKRWNGRRYEYQKTYNSYDFGEKSFPRALLWHLGDVLEKKGYDIECDDYTSPARNTARLVGSLLEPREHQIEFHNKLVQDEEGIGSIISATGSGKSWMIADTINHLNVFTLVITATRANRDGLAKSLSEVFGNKAVSTQLPSSTQVFGKKKDIVKKIKSNFLKEQMEEKLDTPESRYLIHTGFRPSRTGWYKTKKKMEGKFGRSETIKMSQIYVICAESIPKLPQDFINEFEAIIVDEGHKFSEELSHFLDSAENVYWRYFFSATMWRDRDEDMRRLLSISSNRIIYEEVTKVAMEKGRVAKLNFHQIRPPKPLDPAGEWVVDREGNYKIDFDKDPDSIFKKGIICNVTRNKNISEVAIDRYQNNRKVMICVEEEAHGHILKERIESTVKDLNVHLYYGGLDNKSKAVIQEIASDSDEPFIVITTYALAIAADTREVDVTILADARKSSIKSIQRIGRGQRLKDDGRDTEVYYFYDWFHPTLEKHSQEVWKIIKKNYESDESYTEGRFDKIKTKLSRI